MVYQSNSPEAALPNKSKLKNAVKSMPRWKWRLLGVGLVVGLIGVAGEAAILFHGGTVATGKTTTVTKTVVATPGAPPVGSSGFVGAPSNNSTPPGTETTVTTTTPTDASPSLVQALTPFMTHVGFSLFIGVVVGLIFRTFLKMALSLTAVVMLGAWALSYYHIMNVDMTLVKDQTAQATSWLADQGYRLRDMLFHALPSSSGATVGFILGFKKR